jgi:hypothetical protein
MSSMVNEWIGWGHFAIPAAHKALADRVACAMNPDPGAIPGVTEEFVTKLRAIGSEDTDPSHYSTAVLLKATGIAILDSFFAGGYPSVFTSAGITTEELDTLRDNLLREYGDRATYEGNGLAFIASIGLEILPES